MDSIMKKQIGTSVKYLINIVFYTLMIFIFGNSWAASHEKNDKQISEEDRRTLLTSISQNSMLPIFKELSLASETLLNHTESFCKVKTKSSLKTVRDSWADTANAWQQADSLLFGPSVDDNIDFTVYFLPIKKANIKILLKKENIALEDIDSAGVGAQGFGALEYLLFSRKLSVIEINQTFIDEPNRCNYLIKATELLNNNINSISRQWQHYGVQFGLAGNDSLFFIESNEAMTILINKIYQSAQKVSIKKVGLFSSKNEIKNSTSFKLPAWRSGSSLVQVKANITGIKRILDDGKILQWLKNNNQEKAAEKIMHTIDNILKQTLADDDMFKAPQTSKKDLDSLVKNTKKLTKLISTQLAPGLGIELGFNNNDGD
jgi:predicted lipoprotein